MKTKYFSDLNQGRENNFDFIRFIAATMVILTHAFTLGKSDLRYTGDAGVIIFFVTSGFLITQSFERSKNIGKFVKARFLRIYPALFFVTLFTILVIGPLATTVSLNEYFTSSKTWFYLTRMTAFTPDIHLPGVFQNSVKPFADAINSPLWTIKYEIICYFLVGALGFFGILKNKVIISLFIANIIFHFFPTEQFGKTINDIANLSYPFLIGMIFYKYRNAIKHSLLLFVLSILMVVLSIYLGYFNAIFPLFGGYAIFYLVFSPSIKFHNFAKYGDFSYGLYIFAFPIQQLLLYYFENDMSPLQNFFYSFPLALIMAAISWHFIEKPSLKLKNVKFPLLEKDQNTKSIERSKKIG